MGIHSGQPFNVEYRLWDRKENRFKWFVGRALPVRDASGTIVKWFGTCTDIDEQKSVQEDLRRANQDLEQFAFSASHDLQEPLRTINIYSELIEKRYGHSFENEALIFFRYVRESARRMEMLLSDLLKYTRITKIEKLPERSSSAEALEFALSSLAETVSESGAQIHADALPDLPVHATHLRQLFQNLIGNAIKYRSRDRRLLVHLTARRQSEEWVFSVQDNGIGIPAEYRETIFGLFKRLHSSEECSGTGIGLAICQRIVERYHGRIWVESEPGRGSNFLFTLPA